LLARVSAAEAGQKLLETQIQYESRAREESREIAAERVGWHRRVITFLGALVVGLMALVAVMSMWHMLH
jgi:hypothetical protein